MFEPGCCHTPAAPPAPLAEAEPLAFPPPPRLSESALPARARRRLEREIAEAFRANPKTPAGLAGYCCVLARAALGLRRSEYLELSAIKSDHTLRLAEQGRARITTYRQLLLEWPALAARAGAEPAARIEALRREAAQLLTLKSGLKLPVNRFLLELSLIHGRQLFETCLGNSVHLLRNRDREGYSGPFRQNLRAVREMVLCLSLRARGQSPSPLDIWRHPDVQRLLALSIEEQISKAGPRGAARELAVRMRLYASLKGANSHTRLARNFGISNAAARALTRGELPSPAHVQKILSRLSASGHIPPEEAAALTQRCREAHTLRAPSPAQKLSREIWSGLGEHYLTAAAAARLLGIRRRDPGRTVRKFIDELRLESRAVPLHALACLAGKDLHEAESLVEKVLGQAASRPRNQGREFSYARQLLLQFGLEGRDLPPEVRGHPIPRFALGTDGCPRRKLVRAIMDAGDGRSLEALRRWLESFSPQTPAALAAALKCTAPSLQRVRRRAHTSHEVINRVAAGSLIPSLPLLVRLAEAGGILPNEALIANWHLLKAESFGNAMPPLGRALGVLGAAHAGSFAGFYAVLSAGRDPGAAAHDLALWVRDWQRDLAPAPGYETKRFQRLLQALKRSGLFEEPLFRWLELSRSESAPERRLEEWCRGLPRGEAVHLEAALREIAQGVERNAPASLREAFAEKARVKREYDRLGRGRPSAKPYPDTYRLRALGFVPGVTPEELWRWVKSGRGG